MGSWVRPKKEILTLRHLCSKNPPCRVSVLHFPRKDMVDEVSTHESPSDALLYHKLIRPQWEAIVVLDSYDIPLHLYKFQETPGPVFLFSVGMCRMERGEKKMANKWDETEFWCRVHYVTSKCWKTIWEGEHSHKMGWLSLGGIRKGPPHCISSGTSWRLRDIILG